MRDFFLRTKLLGFSHWDKSMVDYANLLWGGPLVTKYISKTGIFTLDEIEKRLQTEIENDSIYGVSYWPIFLLSTNEFIGCCGLRPYNIEEKAFELGVHLLPDFWGKGYASDACQKVLSYGLETISVTSIFAGHNPNNTSSGKLLNKLGFIYIKDEFYPPTGLYHPSYMYKPN